MELRKLQKTGNNTLIISLPKWWIKKNNLKKGDEVLIKSFEKALLISKKEERTQRICELNHFKDMELMIREIIAKYVQGYDQIIIKNVSNIEKNIILEEKIKKILTGIEFSRDLEKKKIIISIIIDERKIMLIDLLKKAVFNIKAMLSLFQNKQQVDILENEIDRITILASRIINRIFLGMIEKSGSFNLPILKSVFDKLESCADSIERIGKYGYEPKQIEIISEIIDRIKMIVDLVPVAIIENNKEAAHQIVISTTEDLEKKLFSIRKRQKESNNLAIFLEHISRVRAEIKDIGELAIDMIF